MLHADIYDEAKQTSWALDTHCLCDEHAKTVMRADKILQANSNIWKKWLNTADLLCLFNPMPCFVTIMVGNKVGVVQCTEKISVAPKPWKEQLN